MAKIEIEKNEWEDSKDAILEKLKHLAPDYSGFLKCDKKDFGLKHSFMGVIENGEMTNIFAMARKKALEEGMLGEGAFSVVALAQTENGHKYAMKIQGVRGKQAIEADLIIREMNLLKAANELEEEGFYENKAGNKKHYSFMKLKQGDELFKQIYLPIDAVRAQGVDNEHLLTFKDSHGNDVFLERQDMPRKRQLLLAVKCLQGIEALHNKNIVHRDIKPENILARFGAGEKSEIIIVSPTDFGLSDQLQNNEIYRT